MQTVDTAVGYNYTARIAHLSHCLGDTDSSENLFSTVCYLTEMCPPLSTQMVALSWTLQELRTSRGFRGLLYSCLHCFLETAKTHLAIVQPRLSRK